MRLTERDGTIRRNGRARRRTASAGFAIALLASGLTAAEASSQPAEAAQATTPLQTAQQSSPARSFDIPAQDLNAALLAFAEAAGMQVFYDADRLAGLRSPGVRGSYAPADALETLLAGTGVTYRLAANGTFTLDRTPVAAGPLRVDPITVLGTRQVAPVPLSNVPASVAVVDREAIRSQQATAERIEDILTREVPGFNPTNNGVRQIRGRTAQVFINGVPVNEQLRASSGSDLNLVTPDQLDFVEVSRGANSAYGFGSPGGVIALSTPRAESEELTLNSRIAGSVNPHHPGGSYRTSVYQSVSRIVGDFDFHIGGSLGYDGQEFTPDGDRALAFNSPNGLANNKEFLSSFDGSFGYDLGDHGRLRLTATHNYVDVLEGYGSDGLGTYRGVESSVVRSRPADRNYREARTANLSYEQPDIWGSALKLEFLHSDTYTESYSTVGGRISRDEQYNQYLGLRSAATTPLDVVSEGMSVTYGADILRNRYYRPTYFTDTGEVRTYFSPDVTLDTSAPYVQLDVPVGAVRFSGGVRHEMYSGHADTANGPNGIVGGDIRSFDLTLYNAGAVYDLNDATELFASYSQGAELTQLGRAARSASTAAEIDAQPAKSDQYEIGMRNRWNGVRTSLSGFYTESDLMSSLVCDGVNPCTPLREPRQIWGVEGTIDWKYDDTWSFGGVAAWQDGVRFPQGQDGRRIGTRDVPPFLASGYVGISPWDGWRNTIRLDYRHSRDEFGQSTAFGEGRIDSVFLVHLSAELDIGGGVLRLGVRNLLNEKYFSIPAEAGNGGFSWVPEEGTRVSLSYSLRW